MTTNPYQPPNRLGAKRTTSTRWLLYAGGCLLLLAVVCVATTVLGMMRTFSEVAAAESANPADLAQGIAWAVIPSFAAFPLAVLGIVLLVLGFAIRRPG